MSKPSIPKGTRDFSPAEVARRNYIFQTIKSVYEKYGYEPIETPAMENITTLTGKYGDEGDQLIFKILNSRLYEAKNKNELSAEFAKSLERNINSELLTEKALRYDLTVPFARYVAMHQNEITFPFKRYQVQPVWRADRPQKGRYREFYQCDADVIGSDSLLNEVELIQIIHEVFFKLGIQVKIKINNRKILSGIAEVYGDGMMLTDLTAVLDKLDKTTREAVIKELQEKRIGGMELVTFLRSLDLAVASGMMWDRLKQLRESFGNSSIGLKGIEEIEYIRKYAEELGIDILEFDLTLARGLNYYTGTIIEVKVDDPRSPFRSSICGGGRYDDLTGIFGLPGISGVGISFGADRIYDVLEEVCGFPASATVGTKVLFINFGPEEQKYCLPLVKKVRANGISAELYPEAAKLKKQMGYADAKKIPFVVLAGTEEMKSNLLTVKDMASGQQEKITVEGLIMRLKAV